MGLTNERVLAKGITFYICNTKQKGLETKTIPGCFNIGDIFQILEYVYVLFQMFFSEYC